MAAKRRVLLFPWLAHGHVFPFLQLAKMLSNRNFHSHLCSTPVILDSLRNALTPITTDVELVPLHLPESPELPPHRHTTKNLPPDLMPSLIGALQKSIPAFTDLIADLQPDLLVFDAFQPWSAKIASSYGIPSVYFQTSSSTAMAFFHHWYAHSNFLDFPFPAIFLRDYETAALRTLPAKGAFRIQDEEGRFCFGAYDLSREIILAKSCRSIEGKYMDYLSTLTGKKVVSVGPLVNQSSDSELSDPDEIMEFLDRKPASSTVYISLGSENYFSEAQIGEMAKGLDLSSVNFIWVARSPTGSIEEKLPEGFVERTKSRGKIVKWAPQSSVLAHPSVGSFICHCGWSSVTESVYLGVPVVALPLKLDQPVNARVVVELGVGVEIVKDEDGGFVGEAVARAVEEVILEERGEELRRRAGELGKKMKMEQEEAFSELAEELLSICSTRNEK